MESSTVKPTAAQSTSTSTDATPVAKDMKHAGLQELCGKRDAGAILPTAGAPLQLAGLRLVEANLSELDLSGADLSGAELLNCDFTGSRLVGANLTDAVLHNADMTNVELLGSDISRADFTNSTLHKAGLGTVTAHETVFFGATCHEATFSGADMTGCDLRAAKLDGARMIKTNLDKSVCTNAVLSNVDMTSTSVHDASFHDAALHGASLRGVSGYKSADWIGADIQNADFNGAWNLRRHIQDENYIHEFRTQSKKHEVLYRVWSITSDCGRSLARWSLWTVLVALIYAYLYTLVDIDWGDYETPLSPVYYSVVTFTTLGYGDVLPGSVGAQVMAMSEVVLGYFSLGGMMSILSDKMARRAG
jgi:uncharacterized protein YjbI with pentapeptide repeats